jgi:hypothetical protein
MAASKGNGGGNQWRHQTAGVARGGALASAHRLAASARSMAAGNAAERQRANETAKAKRAAAESVSAAAIEAAKSAAAIMAWRQQNRHRNGGSNRMAAAAATRKWRHRISAAKTAKRGGQRIALWRNRNGISNLKTGVSVPGAQWRSAKARRKRGQAASISGGEKLAWQLNETS